MMSALHSVGFPVPQPIHYCNSPDVIGTEFYLMEYVQVSISAFDCLNYVRTVYFVSSRVILCCTLCSRVVCSEM